MTESTFPKKASLLVEESKRFKRIGDPNSLMFVNRCGQSHSRINSNKFILHDAPANSDDPHIHLGNGLNKILKDIIAKVHYFDGSRINFRPGWSSHEPVIEQQVVSNNNDNLSPFEIRKKSQLLSTYNLNQQKAHFRTLGICGNWENPYFTSSKECITKIYFSFISLIKNGLICEKEKPILWSWKLNAPAVSSKVVYKEHKSKGIYVSFRIKNAYAFRKFKLNGSPKLIVWTTSPWTLPANMAIALNPSSNYILTKNGCIVSEACHSKLIDKGIVDKEIVATDLPLSLSGGTYINPLLSEESNGKIILDKNVPNDVGTGCMHVAPGYSEEDYRIKLRHNLPSLNMVDEAGKYNSNLPDLNIDSPSDSLEGINVFDAETAIVRTLKKNFTCLGEEPYVNFYPYCSETDTPLIYRSERQWYFLTDKLQEKVLEQLDEIEAEQDTKDTLTRIIKAKSDWCISRQNKWGTPIALLRHKESGHILLHPRVISRTLSTLVVDANKWFSCNIKDVIPLDLQGQFNPDDFVKITDVLDEKFDCANSYHILPKFVAGEGNSSADLCIEGRDKLESWFVNSLFVSTGLKNSLPYKKIVTHGLVLDENGDKLVGHKNSKIRPSMYEIINVYGVEILRLWAATIDYKKDQKINHSDLDKLCKEYQCIRDVFQFMLKHSCYQDEFFQEEFDHSLWNGSPVDSWILAKTSVVFQEVHEKFREYNFAHGMRILLNFMKIDLMKFYFPSVNNILCHGNNDNEKRKEVQKSLTYILRSLIGLLAPILTHTCDEVLEYAQKIDLFKTPDIDWGGYNVPSLRMKNKVKNIFDFEYIPFNQLGLPDHAAGYPDSLEEYVNDFEQVWKPALDEFNSVVAKLVSEGRIINSLELIIRTQDVDYDMQDWFICSGYGPDVEGEQIGEFTVDNMHFSILKSPHNKCSQCGKHTDSCNCVMSEDYAI